MYLSKWCFQILSVSQSRRMIPKKYKVAEGLGMLRHCCSNMSRPLGWIPNITLSEQEKETKIQVINVTSVHRSGVGGVGGERKRERERDMGHWPSQPWLALKMEKGTESKKCSLWKLKISGKQLLSPRLLSAPCRWSSETPSNQNQKINCLYSSNPQKPNKTKQTRNNELDRAWAYKTTPGPRAVNMGGGTGQGSLFSFCTHVYRLPPVLKSLSPRPRHCIQLERSG